MKFKDMGLAAPEVKSTTVKINDTTELTVRSYLPIEEKIELLQYVINCALDEMTGRFSPIRTEVYFNIALTQWYAGIEYEDLDDVNVIYDTLEYNNVISMIISAIPQDEYEYMCSLVNDTVKDIADYNSSAAGIIRMMSADGAGLNSQIEEILGQIKNAEGLEQLSVIKDVVGKD